MSEVGPVSPVREGDVLAKKYRVEKVLGVGGMGVVVAATHLQLDQRVALKFLHGEALTSSDAVARFSREARAAARIKSEHVARVLDVGELDSGSPFLVMEFLEGEDLGQRLDRDGALSVAEAIGFVLQACDAIAEAHAANIVHRDLKPSNLFLAKRPDKTSIIKVLDFGISKATGPAQGQLTSTQALLGSPLYMSPEQMMAPKTVDHRTDLWAIGIILYELLTGTLPFHAETMPQLVAKVLAIEPPLVTDLRPEVSPALAMVIARCLEKDKNARFPNIGALATALAPFAPIEARHIPERIARVLGGVSPVAATLSPSTVPLPRSSAPELPSLYESSIDSRRAPDAPATEIYENTLRIDGPRPAMHTAPTRTMPQHLSTPVSMRAEPIVGTISKASWGATRDEVDAPPITSTPLKAIAGIAVAILCATIAVFALRMRDDRHENPASASAQIPSNVAPSVTVSSPIASDAPTSAPVISVSALPIASSSSPPVPKPAAPIAVKTKTLAQPIASAQAPTPPPPPAEPVEPPNKMKMDVK